MWKKIHDRIQWLCDSVELLIAIVVAVVLLVVLVLWLPRELKYIFHMTNVNSFIKFLEQILHVVVGIEFIKLMCKPNTENVVEVLIFVIARHMIVDGIGGVDLFLYVLAIIMLILVQQMPNRMLHHMKNVKGEAIDLADEDESEAAKSDDEEKDLESEE